MLGKFGALIEIAFIDLKKNIIAEIGNWKKKL
jgi:hypothetical protein